MDSINTDTGEIEIAGLEDYSNITFYGKNDSEIGRLEWDDDKMVFKGKAKESAQVFFDYLLKTLINPYIEEKLRIDREG